MPWWSRSPPLLIYMTVFDLMLVIANADDDILGMFGNSLATTLASSQRTQQKTPKASMPSPSSQITGSAGAKAKLIRPQCQTYKAQPAMNVSSTSELQDEKTLA